MGDFIQIFLISRNTEILIKLNYWLEMYVAYILDTKKFICAFIGFFLNLIINFRHLHYPKSIFLTYYPSVTQVFLLLPPHRSVVYVGSFFFFYILKGVKKFGKIYGYSLELLQQASIIFKVKYATIFE